MGDAPPRDYLDALSGRLAATLAEDLVAVSLIGSAAMGEWVADTSDIDVLVVVAAPLHEAQAREVVATVGHRALPCPARALELVVYRRDALAAPGASVDFELNLNTGHGVEDHVTTDPSLEPAHWFLLDVAMAREHGRALLGPPPARLIGPVAREHALRALLASLGWHGAHEPATAGAVLNACRAWRYASEGTWTAKSEAGRWALDRGAQREAVEPALAVRAGAHAVIDLWAARVVAERAREAVGEALSAVAP